MRYKPLNYGELNIIEGSYSPSMVKSYNNQTFCYWERSLFQRACSVIQLNGLPNNWGGSVKDFLFYCLFKAGFVGVTELEDKGLIFQPCTLNGYDFFYQPTNLLISNPALPETIERTIGKDGELIKLTPDYMGIWDIIAYYAEKLSVLDNAINISLINNKYSFFLGARNKTASEAIKKMLDKVNRGEPAVVYDMKLLNDPTDKAEPWQFLERKDLKSSYLTTEQLMDFSTLLNNFDAEIGIPTVPYQKKERMVTDEATSRQIDALSRATIWVETLNTSLKEVNKMFNTNITASLRYTIEGVQNG